ncbi:MAG TPA: DUF3168 domain-containing protein [Paracoccus sp. (in: a-proteobacteria)]|uniref:tail completion protein gp17 n=1 Tax=Paracoccus sp. TaxID=267 RepID=UPI002BA54AE7|nr:DUF3168 domain-containing protein [Paracoccus sp. (in: a-proteobacteria)]HWL56534.1 DUF3168 domain-containing protein [Paracoccus sp. (in: a-proteobacteria)]
MTPDIALQRAVGGALVATSGVVQHVSPLSILAGTVRPSDLPGITMAPAKVEILGRASGGYVVTEVRMMLHIWTDAKQGAIARQITSAAMLALMDAPRAQGCTIEEWDRPAMAWVPDPDPAMSFAHAAINLRAVIYWRAS